LHGQFPESTSMTYLNVLLPYFSWLLQFSNYQGKIICWDTEPDRIREAVHNYLIQKLVCKIRDYNGSNMAVNLTAESPKTIRIFLSALKKFYAVMIREEMYLYSKCDRELTAVLSRYKRLTKQDLIDRLIQCEQYVAETKQQWVIAQFQSEMD
jgi:hypothetical protein